MHIVTFYTSLNFTKISEGQQTLLAKSNFLKISFKEIERIIHLVTC